MMPAFRNRRRKRPRGKQFRACMGCGSGNLEKVRYFDGPVTYDHDTAEAYVCSECGRTGIPCLFDTEQDRERFRKNILEKERHKN